jgi:1-acyl-sn-glycerol-3-phosphate acyltransferase
MSGPRRGLIAEHVSLYDPPFLISCWPTAPEAVGAVEIWQRPGQSLLVKGYGVMPVPRGQFSRSLLEKMIAALRSGRALVIAPEGGRSHTPGMQRAHPGVAYVADKTGVPVLPVGLVGTTDDYLQRALRAERPPLEMRIGEPLSLPPVHGTGLARKQTLQANADQTMQQIALLLPPEYRGVYG